MRQSRQYCVSIMTASARKIACELGVARSTIHDNLKRAAAAGSLGR